MSDTIVIAQCTGTKRDGEWPARELYMPSDYFRKQRRYAEIVGDAWYIQSAEYGLLEPDTMVPSYDTHAKDIDREPWGRRVAAQLAGRVPDGAVVKVLGGKLYADPLIPHLESRGYEVHEPLRGQRIGTRKQTLKRLREQHVTQSVVEGSA